MYHEGKGVQQDYSEAISWYRKAAYQGDAQSEYALGYMYYYGQGLPQDYSDAIRWYRKAADHGYPDARRALASIERRSTGRKIDYFGFLVSLVGGLIFSLDFLRPGRSFRNSRHETALGVVALCYATLRYAALSLYGITHDHMRYSAYHNLFHWGRGLLGGMAIILSMPFVLSKRNRAEAKLEKSDPD